MFRWASLVVLFLLSCQSPYSSQFQNEEGGFPESSQLLTNSQGENAQWAGVGRLNAAMTCTAVYVQTHENSSSPARILTNGHCVQSFADRSSSYEVWVNRPAPKSWTVTLNAFVDTTKTARIYPIKNILYSTMNAADLAVLDLDVTQAQLAADGIRPVPFADKTAVAGANIRVLGLPEAGFSTDQQYLRVSRCVEETRVSIVEWYWHWFDMHRNACADIREGSSGSAVVNDQGQLFALLNTTSQGAISESCYLGNPCELQTPGAFMLATKNYAVDLVELKNCFDKQSNLNWNSSCPLPKPDVIRYENAPAVPIRPVNAQLQPNRWNIQLSSESFDQVRFKFGAVGEVDCRDDDLYAASQSVNMPIFAEREVPTSNGVYLLCLWGHKGSQAADLRFPTIVVLSIDSKEPTLKPQIAWRATERGVQFEPLFQVPELSSFWVGFGPLASTRCDSLALKPYRRIPLLIPKDSLPAKVCVQAEDHAGNRGAIFDYDRT